MIKWWQTSLLLSCYGFFKEYRPSEPYIAPFLTGPWKNFTDNQVTQEIYPIGTYCNLSLLIVVFLLTDYLRYKAVLLVGGLAGIVTWSLLSWGKTIFEMEIVEFFYGLFMSSEVAYYTYIYAKVDKEHYQKVTSHARTAFLLGKASAGISSQLFVQFHLLDYLELNYLTIGALAITTLIGALLPSVPQSMYFHRGSLPSVSNASGGSEKEGSSSADGIPRRSWRSRLKEAFLYLYLDLKDAYTNCYVVKWSVWWALATCGYLQIITYCQLLWEEINRESSDELYNGLVEFAYSVLGALFAFGVGYLKVPWHKWGELTLGLLTLVQGACIFAAAHTTNLYLAYAMHIAYGILYQAAITIASFEVAKDLRDDSYALIFGINTFFALLMQTVLTAVVVKHYECPIRLQIYGYYEFVTGDLFLLIALFAFLNARKSRSPR